MAHNHKPNENEKQKFLQSINSYLGILRQDKTYRFRTAQLARYMKEFWQKYFSVKDAALKVERLGEMLFRRYRNVYKEFSFSQKRFAVVEFVSVRFQR